MSARRILTYLDLLFGAEPQESLVDLRVKRPEGGMRQEFHPVRARDLLQRRISTLGATRDLYVGVVARGRREGGRDALVSRAHVLWADLDTPEAIANLARFVAPPSLVVNSGSGRHAYWSIWPSITPSLAERMNRRLAHALGGDAVCAEAARILRPPGTFNFKGDAPRPVTIEALTVEIYRAEQVAGNLPDPPETKARPRPTGAPRQLRPDDDLLMSIEPAEYVATLTGQEIGRDGKVRCPFHPDRTPSLHVYQEPERGWACFGCGKGGTIIDFGGYLYGIEPRGRGYHEIRRRLAADTLQRAAA